MDQSTLKTKHLKDKKNHSRYIFVYLSQENPVRVKADSFITRGSQLQHTMHKFMKKPFLKVAKSICTCDEQFLLKVAHETG